MRTVLVTGGAGFIGSHLVDQLLEDGAVVRVLDNLSSGSLRNLQAAAERQSRVGGALSGSRLEVIIGDVRDRELLRKALRNVTHVFHLAALPPSASGIPEPGATHTVNVEGTLNVLHGALTEGVWRVVLASCASVYGAADTGPISEDAPLRPTSLFAASKVAAETYCQAFYARHQLDTVTLRYFQVYGPRQRPGSPHNLVPNLIEALRKGRLSHDWDDLPQGDFIYVDDAVAATLAAGRAPRVGGRVVNIGAGQLASMGDVLHILSDLMKTAGVTDFSGSADSQPHVVCADTTVASELLGFVPRVSLVSGLARVVRSMSDEEAIERAALAPIGLDD